MKTNLFALGAACALMLAGCGGNSGASKTKVTGVTLNETSKSLEVDDTFQLYAYVQPEYADNTNVTWSASGNGVVSVDDGLVTALRVGESTVTVTTVDGGYTASCVFTVSEKTVPVTGVSLDKNSATVRVGESLTLTARVAPDNATNKSVIWTTSDSEVATVSEGVVTAIKEGNATITVTTSEGLFEANCVVTVVPTKPAGAVDLQYVTDDTIGNYPNQWCYFNDPQGWSKASVTMNDAYEHNNEVVLDYTYNVGAETPDNWTLQLRRKNTSLKVGSTYELRCKVVSNKAGKIILNNAEKDIIIGENNLTVTYQEVENKSFMMLFPYTTIGDARVVVSNVSWEAALEPPTGVEVNPVADGYIVAFAAVEGATGYKAYYVNSEGQDVANEEVTNGGKLTKVSTLADGKYKVFVTTIKGEKESARSTSYGTIEIGEVPAVVPAGGPKTNMEFGEEHKWPSTDLALPDDKFVYWNDQNWNGSQVAVSEAYTEEGTVHASYSITSGSCDFGFQILYKNTSLKADKKYTLSFTINSLAAGKIRVNDVADVTLVAGEDVKVSFEYKEIANNASMKLVFPTSLGDNTVVISNISWEEALEAPAGVVVNKDGDDYIVQFAAVAGADGYKAYYVNSEGTDVANEAVTNGGKLTKVSTLADGKYKVYVTTIKGEKESSRSESFGTIEIGDIAPVVPAGGPKTAMEFGEEHTEGVLALPDDKFVYWNDQGWCGSVVEMVEAYTEEGTVHASYTIDHDKDFIPSWAAGQTVPGCDYSFQIFYKNTSLTAGAQYTLKFSLLSASAGQVKLNNQSFNVEASTAIDLSVDYTEVANDASFALVFPSSMNSNTIVISNISWTAK